MTWHAVCAVDDLPSGARQVLIIDERQVLVVNHKGTLYAVDNRCPHLKMPLEEATISDSLELRCPWHHSTFDLETGNLHAWCSWPPGIGVVLGKLSAEASLPTFPVKAEDGTVWVEVI